MSVEAIPQTLPEAEDTGVFLRLWSRAEYEQAIQRGWFTPEEVELRDGELLYRRTGEPRCWTREEYYKAYDELGWFDGQRVERLYGKLYRKLSQNPPHSTISYLIGRILTLLFGNEFYIDRQRPVPIKIHDDPEPDVFVARGSWENYTTRHPGPEDVVLIVEVSDTTLRYDRGPKAAKYAEADIPEYWIMDVNARRLIVHRDPVVMPESPSGFGYSRIIIYSEDESISLVAAPELTLCVSELLPPASP